VLHKVDLVDEMAPWKIGSGRIHPEVPIVRAVHGDVDPRLLFGEMRRSHRRPARARSTSTTPSRAT
jgi:G3E family GTPase